MTVWFTSDLHVGHVKVAEIRAAMVGIDAEGYHECDLAEEHDRTLAASWDELVRPDDVVWVLGDISAGGSAAQRNALEWLKARPGVKHLIAGNHDGCSPVHRNSHRWFREYLEAFESVQSAARRRVPLARGHADVVMSHYPYCEHPQPGRTPDRFTQWWLRDEGKPILHGHTHSDEKVSYSLAGALQVSVGVDAWGFAPVSLDQLGDIMDSYPLEAPWADESLARGVMVPKKAGRA